MNSFIVFHRPQAGHLPTHFVASCPHSSQTYIILSLAIYELRITNNELRNFLTGTIILGYLQKKGADFRLPLLIVSCASSLYLWCLAEVDDERDNVNDESIGSRDDGTLVTTEENSGCDIASLLLIVIDLIETE